MNRIIGYALAAIVIASSSYVTSTQAADQIRIRLKNNSGYVISHTILATGSRSSAPHLDFHSKEFTTGKSQNVKWSVTGQSAANLDLFVSYDVGIARLRPNCGKVASLKIDKSTKQITNVILPNGTELTTSNKLDNNKDQIVRLDFSVTGFYPGKTKCKYKRGRVYKR